MMSRGESAVTVTVTSDRNLPVANQAVNALSLAAEEAKTVGVGLGYNHDPLDRPKNLNRPTNLSDISKSRRMYWMYWDVLGCILDVSDIFWMY